MLAVTLLIVRRIRLLIPLLLVGLLIPAGLHKPLLGIRLLITLLLIALPIRLLITLLTVWLLISLLTIGLLVSLLTIGLLIVRIPLLTILRLPIAVLRRVALTIGTIRGIALRRRIIALRKTRLLRILSGVPGAIIGWTAVAHPASFPFFRAIVREVPCRALCGGHFVPPPRGLSRKRLNRALHDNASYSIAQKNGL